MRDRIDQLLAEMEDEISKHTHLDQQRREHLQALANHIEQRLNEDREASLGNDYDWSLQESVVLFEEEFPKLATLLREIQRVLMNIGI